MSNSGLSLGNLEVSGLGFRTCSLGLGVEKNGLSHLVGFTSPSPRLVDTKVDSFGCVFPAGYIFWYGQQWTLVIGIVKTNWIGSELGQRRRPDANSS